MNVVSEARKYVMDVVGLSSEEQNHLKQLLNRGVIIPLAVVDSTVEDLRDIIVHNPLIQPNTGITNYYNDTNFYILYIYFGIPHSSALEFRTYPSYFPVTILFSACDILNLMKCHNLVVN